MKNIAFFSLANEYPDMDQYREQIKEWLSAIGKDRHWLAEKCGYKKRTVDNWLSTQEITSQSKAIIDGLMREYLADGAASQNIVLEVTSEQFDAYNAAAMADGMLIRQWLIHLADEAAGAADECPDLDATEPAPTETEEEIAAREVEEYKRNRALHPPRNQSKIAPKKKDTGNDNRQAI